MFWEGMVSDDLLMEMYKTAVLNHLDPEFTSLMQNEIEKRHLIVKFEEVLES